MTVLFEKDWRNTQGNLVAIPHITTKNKSFLRTCQLLKKMNIKNCYFPLSLYDPDLKNIDVHDLEENTPENEVLRAKVMIESRINIWYFMREVLRIYNQGGAPIPFRLDRGNMAMIWCFSNNIDYASIQPRQTGKDQPLYSLIQTPTGWVEMGDIKLNDKVVTPDGGTANVIGVYPQGYKPIYRVTFEDGRWTDCGEEHLWKVYNRDWSPENNRWRVITLRDILNRLQVRPGAKTNLYVPLVKPEEKPDVSLPIDPYVMGILLGDGGFTTDTLTLSTADSFIVEEVSKLLPTDVELVYSYSDRVDYRVVDSEKRVDGKTSPFRDTLRSLGILGKYSYEKFIPIQYLESSPSQKLSLLQGLMDSDGTVDISSSLSFSTTSERLANQVQYLVRSLGGICKIAEKQTYYTYNNERKPGRLSYILRIRMNDPKTVFRLPRKIDRVSDTYKSKDKLALRIVSIRPVGCHETQCIEVDHPDHLYVTDNYIVTHNTVGALSIYTWLLYIAGEEFQIGHMSKDNRLREDNVSRIKRLSESLPEWWLHKDKHRDKNNATMIKYAALNTELATTVAQDNAVEADKQGRGASIPVFWWDELEYITNIKVSYSTIIASGGAARKNAKANGKPHSNLITTTTGDPTKQPCREGAEILEGAMYFQEFMYDLKDGEELHKVVESNSPQKMILGMFSHLQLGLSNEWLRDEINKSKASRDKVMRDYLNRRVSIQEDPVIPAHILATITSSEREASWNQIRSDGFVVNWYLSEETIKSPFFKERPVIVGCDSSEMIGRDCTTLVGVDPRSLETVFTFRAAEGNINVVGVMIAQFLMEFPAMLWIPENKSSGTSLIDIVSLFLRKNRQNPFKRIFNWVVQNNDQDEFKNIDIKDDNLLNTHIKRYFGIKTDQKKREELYSTTLLQGAKRSCSRIRDRHLIQELSSLTIRNGRVDHAAGGHDDTVIGWLMALWTIFNGKHLHLYGIKPGTILSTVDNGQPDKVRLQEEQHAKLREKAEQLERAMRLQPDPGYRRMIQADLDLVKSMMKSDMVPVPTTADDLTRDPNRYTDPGITSQLRKPVNTQEVERSIKMLLGG